MDPTLSPADHVAIAEKVAELVALQSRQPTCACLVSNERHERHHELIDELIDFFDRFRTLRWGVARAVATVLVLAMVGVFSVGLVMTAWAKVKALTG
jgi:hypothetical protein